MNLKKWNGFCLCAEADDLFPQGAQPCETVSAPLVFLVRRDPMKTRGLYRINDLAELSEPETVACLTPAAPAAGELADFVRSHGAGVLRWLYADGICAEKDQGRRFDGRKDLLYPQQLSPYV